MSRTAAPALRAVLLDLDGTLVDTLPDLHAALGRALDEAGLAPPSAATLRALVSHGAAAMLDAALDGRLERAARDALLERFLARYEADVAARSRLVPGMDRVLADLEARAMPWGIVTSKLARFTGPLVRALALDGRAACVVSGDTTARGKPDPDPLQHACACLALDPAGCAYVGDARADVAAGHAAGMRTVVAAFGYLAADDDPAAWGAEAVVDTPAALLEWIRLAVGERAGHA